MMQLLKINRPSTGAITQQRVKYYYRYFNFYYYSDDEKYRVLIMAGYKTRRKINSYNI